jgi:hypothetical protein
MPTPLLHRLLCASVLLAAIAARAQLVTVSPFLPLQGSRGGAAPTADAPLEFRGVAELPDGPAFRVVDPARKMGAWVRLNELDSDLGVVVKQHDPDQDTVTVEHQGRTFTLALRQSKIVSTGAAKPNAAIGSPSTPVPTTAATTRPAPTATLQQTQIDAVAAAVAQRRALRDQATQQLNQGMPLAPQAGQQPGAQNPAGQNQNGQNATNAQGGQNGRRGPRTRQPQQE